MVGKGIVFDSGGLSLKPADGMETMKTDMSGAAAVFGAMEAIATLQLPVKVLALAPLTENMPAARRCAPATCSRRATARPSRSSTPDAEGRLVLADGLSLAGRGEAGPHRGPGHSDRCLHDRPGEEIAGLFGTGDAPRSAPGAEAAGERVWQLPLPPDYRKKIDSDVPT